MLRLSIVFAFVLSQFYNSAQQIEPEIPQWAILMYDNFPNTNGIDSMYVAYYKSHDYKKNTHTQYYKKWRRNIERYINNEGFIDTNLITLMGQKMNERKQDYLANQLQKSGNWTPLGPWDEKKDGGVISKRHTNVTSMAICESYPNVIYCGTEPGEIYKSIDGGENWFNVSYGIVTTYVTQAVIANASFHGLAVDPQNPDLVYAVAANEIFISNDGGVNWISNVFANVPLFGYIETPFEIQIDPANSNRLFIAGLDGLHLSVDGGQTWVQVFTEECWDIKFQPNNPLIIYALRDNPTAIRHEFVRSIDGGASWTVMTNGWYNSTDAGRNVIGGRIAVSQADPTVVYSYLIGDSKSGDDGFIGIYKSNDSGTSWVNVLGYDGGPYTASHPNLLASDPISGFNQGMYNCGLMVSNSNANEILVGGINLWKSLDGGLTYDNLVDYYQPGLYDMHVDMQDFRAVGNTYWVSTDGGMFKSTDFFASEPEFKMKGIQGADFWGFGSGWNFDVFGGGKFHNGVAFHAETYQNGEFFNTVNGEPASGYVSPGDSNRVFWTGNSLRIPFSTNGSVSDFYSLGVLPNESPWFAQSSKLLFHPSCYNHIYTGNDNLLMKSEDGGANFITIFTAPANSEILDIEISRPNSQQMFAVAVNASFTSSSIYKTTDHWQTSTVLTLPAGGSSRILIDVDAENEDILWLCYPRGNNGEKVYKSIDGGQSWINLTSSELDDQRIYSLTAVGGTDGGVYLNTNITCYYRNNSMSSWAIDNLGLPLSITTKDILPFYRDGKVRIGSYGKGIWESPLYEAPSRPVAQIMVNQLQASCAGELFYFDDYSMLNHAGATWSWTFENANIMTSSLRNPQVSFITYGSHLVTLTVTNGNGISSTDSLYVAVDLPISILTEDFEGAFPPNGWDEIGSSVGWIKTTEAGGFSLSPNSMLFDNYSINQVGTAFNIQTTFDLTDASPTNSYVTFDVAYARYSSSYADSLEILASTDCGNTWTSLYLKGGDSLATAPNEPSSAFVPDNTQWRKDTLDLSNYSGEQNLILRFSNINDYGQRLYIDNVNLSDGNFVGVKESNSPTIDVFPNPANANGSIFVSDGTDGTPILFSIYNADGKLIGSKRTFSGESIPLSIWQVTPGTYIITMQNERQIVRSKLIVSGRS